MNNSVILILLILLPFFGKAQLDSVRFELNKKILNHNTELFWSIDTNDRFKTSIFKIDSFSVCSGFNPIRGRQKHDTLFLNFRFECDWSKEKIDSIEKQNLEILKPIVPKYIAFYDSIGWGKARVKKQQLLEQPKSSILQDWYKSKYISEDERLSLFSLVRLPDTLIGTIGIFHDRNFPPMYIIKPDSLELEVDNLLRMFNKDILRKKTILRNEGFFLTSTFKEGI